MPKLTAAVDDNGPSRIACLQCRTKHLKCDATFPRCGRCQSLGRNCEYAGSRRGYRGPARAEPSLDFFGLDPRTFDNPILQTKTMTPGIVQDPLRAETFLDGSDSVADSAVIGSPWSYSRQDNGISHSHHESIPLKSPSQRFVDLYYSHFHRTHPILPPYRHIITSQDGFPDYLQAVVEFVGSHYAQDRSCENLRPIVLDMMAANSDIVPQKVQALTLLSIALHSRDELEDALEYFTTAIDYAVQLGMNRSGFTAGYPNQPATVLESFRRTWWEIYILDGQFAAMRPCHTFRMNSYDVDISLPFDEDTFEACQEAPKLFTLLQLQDRAFAEVDEDFSSFSYRIEATQILGQVIALLKESDPAMDDIDSIDAQISAWTHLISTSKPEILDSEGQVDEMLFQAHMIISCAAIYLHLPRSGLMPSPPTVTDMACTSQMPYSTPSSTAHVHAVKATKAANDISTLASLRTPVHRHSPWFICNLVLGAVVQLSACSVRACRCLDPHKNRIAQAIGFLRALSPTWPIAGRAMRQIKSVAGQVLHVGLRDASRVPTSAMLINSIAAETILPGDQLDDMINFNAATTVA